MILQPLRRCSQLFLLPLLLLLGSLSTASQHLEPLLLLKPTTSYEMEKRKHFDLTEIFFWMSLGIGDFNLTHLESAGKSLSEVRDSLDQAGLWPCLWRSVLIVLCDVRRPNLKVSS